MSQLHAFDEEVGAVDGESSVCQKSRGDYITSVVTSNPSAFYERILHLLITRGPGTIDHTVKNKKHLTFDSPNEVRKVVTRARVEVPSSTILINMICCYITIVQVQSSNH